MSRKEVRRSTGFADMTGFRDPERMRRAFIRAFGQPPPALHRAACA
jgi:AraC-like DNA-binding protein